MDAILNPEYARFLSRRMPRVRERILRLNGPDPDPGNILRGYHPSGLRYEFGLGKFFVKRTEFLKRRTRAEFDALPREAFMRSGKRRVISYAYLFKNL